MPRRKRRASWASITELEKGKRYRIRFWAKGVDGVYRRRSETVRGTRLDAERRRAELMVEHSDEAPCPTVAQAWERWVLPDMERRVEQGEMAKRSMLLYRSAWNKHVMPTWGAVECDAVRPLRVQQWLDTLGRSQAEVGCKVLSKVMDYAVRYELRDTNPMRERYVMPSKSTIERMDAEIWSAQQLVDQWRGLRSEWYEPAYLVAAFGGARVGESLGVRAGDVGLAEIGGVPVATVRIACQIDDGGEDTTRLKTRQSLRVAVLVGPPAVRLAEIAASMPPEWFLTHDGMGNAQPQRRLRMAWGGAHPLRNLRNSWETWMRYDLRAPRWLIERLMGHAGGDVSERYYDRPDDAHLREIMADLYRDRPIFGTNWDESGA